MLLLVSSFDSRAAYLAYDTSFNSVVQFKGIMMRPEEAEKYRVAYYAQTYHCLKQLKRNNIFTPQLIFLLILWHTRTLSNSDQSITWNWCLLHVHLPFQYVLTT